MTEPLITSRPIACSKYLFISIVCSFTITCALTWSNYSSYIVKNEEVENVISLKVTCQVDIISFLELSSINILLSSTRAMTFAECLVWKSFLLILLSPTNERGRLYM